jgi:CRP-like cAMP-binding protein
MLAARLPQQNRLIASLPASVRRRLSPHLELVSLEAGEVLYESGDPLRYVYFPTDSIVSLLQVMDSGAASEISVVGSEGMVNIALFMGGERTTSRAIVQIAGGAFRLEGQLLRDEFNRHGALLVLVLRYTQSLFVQMAQAAVCHQYHTIDQRLCRWLLLSLDRLPSNQLTVTQQFIGRLLGVRRESVTAAAGKLHALGVIKYHRGNITVLNRSKLEKLSCECYALIKKETDLLPSYAAAD